MNTQAHVVTGLWLLTTQSRPAAAWPIAVGGVLPDAPMFVFYAVEKLRGVAEGTIWSSRYYDPGWQTVFDLFNSLPLIAAALVVAWRLGKPRTVAFFGAMGVHSLTDLPLHNDDAHRHFFPLSDWRFESPVSYWDPSRYGSWVSLAEVALVTVGLVVLWRRLPQPSIRGLVVLIAASYVAYFAYVFTVWV